MKLSKSPPKVRVQAAFIDRAGKFKCSGSLSTFPANWYPAETFPPFLVGLNGDWHLCRIVEANLDYGFVAESVADLDAQYEVFPKMEIRR